MNRIPKPGELYRHYTGEVYQILTVAKHSETDERLVVFQAMYGTFDTYASPLSLFISEVDHQKYPRVKQQYWFDQIKKTQLAQEPLMSEQQTADETSGTVEGRIQQQEIDGKFKEPETRLPRGIEGRIGAAGETNQQEINIAGQAAEAHVNQPKAEQPKIKATVKTVERPYTCSPAESKRAFREEGRKSEDIESSYLQRRRRQIADRESRREQFLKPKKQESATDELRANPCLLKFLDADTYEAKYQVLTEIQDEMTDRLIDDMAVVLDVVIPEGPLNDRYYQLRNIILTRQKYETIRYR